MSTTLTVLFGAAYLGVAFVWYGFELAFWQRIAMCPPERWKWRDIRLSIFSGLVWPLCALGEPFFIYEGLSTFSRGWLLWPKREDRS